MGICRAESPRNFEPVRATLSIAQGVSPGFDEKIDRNPASWRGGRLAQAFRLC